VCCVKGVSTGVLRKGCPGLVITQFTTRGIIYRRGEERKSERGKEGPRCRCVCVCVRLCVYASCRERERQTDRQTHLGQSEVEAAFELEQFMVGLHPCLHQLVERRQEP
jgi:hypothetical protein